MIDLDGHWKSWAINALVFSFVQVAVTYDAR